MSTARYANMPWMNVEQNTQKARPASTSLGAQDELVHVMQELIEAIVALKDEIVMERWERRYGPSVVKPAINYEIKEMKPEQDV